MKKLLSTTALCMLVSLVFAQKNVVKEAKKAMDSDKFSEARGLLQSALTNTETATDQETWKVAGDIEYNQFAKDLEKLRRNEPADQNQMYTALYNMYAPYVTADSLGELPDDKGKVKNKVRKDVSNRLKTHHPDYYNGATYYYYDLKDYAKASDFFTRYWELPSLKIFANDPEMASYKNDSTFQIIKYYAVVSTIQAKRHNQAIELLHRITSEPFITNSTYKESDVYELLAGEYLEIGDSARYITALEDGAKKYPKSNFFIPNLVNEFIKKGNFDAAVNYLDQAIANDPTNSCEFYSVKASIFAQESRFDESFDNYQKALAYDAKCSRALEGLAIAYIVKAQNLKESATTLSRKEQAEMDAQANENYKKAIPLLQDYVAGLKANNASNKDVKAALYKLRNVYYNLNMNDEFDTITKEWESL